MKKTLVTLTVAAFVFGALTLAGCAKKKAEETPAAETPAMTDTTAAPAEAAPADTSAMAPADTTAK